MIFMCVFCQEEIGRNEAEPVAEISHGTCEPCAAVRMFEVAPIEAVRFWIRKHPEDVPALALAVLAGCFLVWWVFHGAMPCGR